MQRITYLAKIPSKKTQKLKPIAAIRAVRLLGIIME